MRILIAALICLAALPAAAGQPFSQSMAQCAALYKLGADWTRQTGQADRFATAAQAYHAAAIDQAMSESRARPEAWVDLHMAESYAEWRGNGKVWILTEEFRDWAGYCLKFAKARGIETGLG